MTIVWTRYEAPVGPLLLTGEDGSLTGVWFLDRAGDPDAGGPSPESFVAATEQLYAYFAGELTEFELVLRPRGTAFQLDVWTALRGIAYGETISYGELARRVGRPGAARAVGLANGANPLSIVVPCHRVIGADGSLTGYGGGLDRKRFLLELEARHRVPALFVP